MIGDEFDDNKDGFLNEKELEHFFSLFYHVAAFGKNDIANSELSNLEMAGLMTGEILKKEEFDEKGVSLEEFNQFEELF